MNTGIQRSGTTPQGVLTTTTPIRGKLQKQKDLPAIMDAHNLGYIATASASYPLDLFDKIKKAKTIPGPKYIHIHTPCPPGWGFDTRYTIKVGKVAVECGLYDLYEIEKGERRLTGPSKKMTREKLRPVKDYFRLQSRFKAISESQISEIQQQVNEKWDRYEREGV